MSRLFTVSALLVVVFSSLSFGWRCDAAPYERPREQPLSESQRAERKFQMRFFGHRTFSPALRERAIFKFRQAQLEVTGLPRNEQNDLLLHGPLRAFPFTKKPELRSIGNRKTITLLIDFDDFQGEKIYPGLNRSVFDNIYGNGSVAAQSFSPFDSVHNYYQRASHIKFTLIGDVFRWIRLQVIDGHTNLYIMLTTMSD